MGAVIHWYQDVWEWFLNTTTRNKLGFAWGAGCFMVMVAAALALIPRRRKPRRKHGA